MAAKVLYDGECALCCRLLDSIFRWDRANRLEPVEIQSERGGELLADLPASERLDSWHLVTEQGERRSGAEALAPLLELLPAGGLPARLARAAPGLTDRAYQAVAGNRGRLARLLRIDPAYRLRRR